jgi:hypothetical protein
MHYRHRGRHLHGQLLLLLALLRSGSRKYGGRRRELLLHLPLDHWVRQLELWWLQFLGCSTSLLLQLLLLVLVQQALLLLLLLHLFTDLLLVGVPRRPVASCQLVSRWWGRNLLLLVLIRNTFITCLLLLLRLAVKGNATVCGTSCCCPGCLVVPLQVKLAIW